MRFLSATGMLVLLCALVATGAFAQPYIGLYNDVNRCYPYAEIAAPFTPFKVWVFIQPGSGGSECSEFRLELPYNVIVTNVTLNPAFGLPIDPVTPHMPPGVSICYPDCQTDWFWFCNLDMIAIDVVPSDIYIEPYDLSGKVASTDCSAVKEDMTVINYFGINHYTGVLTPYPTIIDVHLATHTALVAELEYEVEDPLMPPQFTLNVFDEPGNSIEVVGAQYHPSSSKLVIVTLAGPMVHGTSYELHGNVCNRCYCGGSLQYFYFDEEIAASDVSWGTIKSLYGQQE